jgi:hypothetical protein
MRIVRFCNCDAERDRQPTDKTVRCMAVNATPARDQIGAEQVAAAIGRARSSVLEVPFDLAVAADVVCPAEARRRAG